MSHLGLQGPGKFNSQGYMEDVWLSLLNDQVTRMLAQDNRASFLSATALDAIADAAEGVENAGAWTGFDLSPLSVEEPADYESQLSHYTGHDWDVWGLTRMRVGGKWFKAYSRNSLITTDELLTARSRLQGRLLPCSAVQMVKDPRLLLTAGWLLEGVNARVILLSRERRETAESMTSHYGPRLFSDDPFSGFDWVSNHFNYRVPPQTLADYWEASDRLMQRIELDFECVRVDADDLTDDGIDRLWSWASRPCGSAGSGGA